MPARDSNRGSAALPLPGWRSRWRELAKSLPVMRFELSWPRAWAITLALVPALLAGFQLATLAHFLNAQLGHGVPELALGALRGALLFAPISLLAHWVATRRRRVRVARLLPWSLTVVLVAAALADWVHASRYSFYLAPAADANLIKLALWLSLGAVLAFYTALLHTVHHRRYGAKSVALLVLVALGSLYVARARLESYRPPAAPTVSAPVRISAAAPQLVMVNVDGATLDVLLPLARQARLPFFATLLESGASARLVPVLPVEPFSARATLASGKLPYRHGLFGDHLVSSLWLPRGELRLAPLGFETLGLAGSAHRRRAVRGDDRAARVLAEMLAGAGARVGVVGAPAALSGGPLLAALVTDERFHGRGEAAAPGGLESRVELARADALRGITGEHEGALATAAPELSGVIAEALLQDRWRAAVAEALLAPEHELDALFVELPGLLAVALETRGGFEAAELEGSRGRAERAAAAALTAYAAALDATLANLWDRMREPRLLAVVSSFGVDRPRGARRLALEIGRVRRLQGSLAGQPDGALWLRGEGFTRPGVALPTARVVDVAPTLLYLSGLPLARDFDGRVLTEAIEGALLQRRPLTFLPSYDSIATNPAPTANAADTAEVLVPADTAGSRQR